MPRIDTPWSPITKEHKRGVTFWLLQIEDLPDFNEYQRLTKRKLSPQLYYLGQETQEDSMLPSERWWGPDHQGPSYPTPEILGTSASSALGLLSHNNQIISWLLLTPLIHFGVHVILLTFAMWVPFHYHSYVCLTQPHGCVSFIL